MVEVQSETAVCGLGFERIYPTVSAVIILTAARLALDEPELATLLGPCERQVNITK